MLVFVSKSKSIWLLRIDIVDGQTWQVSPGPTQSAALPSLPAAVGHLRGRSQEGEGKRFFPVVGSFLTGPLCETKIMKIQELKNWRSVVFNRYLRLKPNVNMLLGQTKFVGSVGAGRISVVLPCLNESEFTIQTVQSFCNRTSHELKSQQCVVLA